MIKGYAVKCTSSLGTFYVTKPEWLDDYTIAADRDADGALFMTFGAAVLAWRFPRRVESVRIFAVAEDGTETPLPTYEEALAAAERAEKALDLERGLRESAERMCERMREERNATYDAHALGKLADELDEDNYASAAKALREAIFMLDKAAKRDAAWARLVEATDGETWGRDFGSAEQHVAAVAELAAARQALLDLGVDAALLSG